VDRVRAASKHWIVDWRPEDPVFWARGGKRVAWRNLIWSIFAENIGFSVWLVWSIVAARLPQAGFPYTTDQLFQLVALPGLVGALMRFPYTFAVPKFGGRNWTVVSALLLLVPTLSLVALVGDPTTPFWLMALAAASAGLGGGNFASSMANISFFFPDREKGFALGLNAAGGNLGVSTVQLVVPLVLGWSLLPGAGPGIHLENAGLIWLPLILLSALSAFFFMDNLSSARANLRDQLSVAREPQTWILSFLYIGTFGSFVGFSAAFPLLIASQFPELDGRLAFVGPLLGSVSRPLGGWLSDRRGGARVTAFSFLVMALASLALLLSLHQRSLGLFVGAMLTLFVVAGIGNGSTFRMIPYIFRALQRRRARAPDHAETWLARSRRDAAAVIGIAAAIGAFGGYFLPSTLGASLRATGGITRAIVYFVLFYALCLAVTWWCYLRARFLTARLPNLADAEP